MTARKKTDYREIDQALIDLAEKHLLAIVYEEIFLQHDVFPSHIDFARAAFSDDVRVPHSKWWRIRNGDKRLSFSDIGRISQALGVDPTSLISRAFADARTGKPLPEMPKIEE